ncbi:MAG: 50S ribosomal protein L30 [Gammaproteobacteria bacterium]|nr:50S ribosomal protein L30 [Gammaproteobacteria bacterium]NIR98758.1 50S ribosomal protein L30 [Gammaproteobacteria bacterium]NIT64468.1 50S ribosomal protein L30 [Gammaproteobacteria bacterium]NIV21388.1 50S ribosomal protein L30 [Gammaproteobacteria bacterium]NIX11258.1 50S ribosomal protein L30 [Gammaproteobacteria bacterium]
MDDTRKLRVTLVKSPSGRLNNHQASVRGLGLRRIHQSVVVDDTPENRGMINRAEYMLKVEEV